MENLKAGVSALVFIALIAAALALALDGFSDQVESDLGVNSSAHNITGKGETGILNATSYLGTIGTLLGVGALVGIVVAAFYIARQ